MSDTRGVVEAFFARGRANDLSIVDLFAEEIEFFIPGDPRLFPFAGMHRQGGSALVGVFEAMWRSRAPGTGQIKTATLIVQGEEAAWIGVGVSHEMNDFSRNSGRRFTLDVA